MSLIIPYEDNLFSSEGAFIMPDGQITYVGVGHEWFAYDYCKGNNFQFLSDVKTGWSYYSDHFEEFQKEYNFIGAKEDLDPYMTTKLSPEQLMLFKNWEELYEFSRCFFSDFLVYCLGFDKVETVMRRAITTTNPNPHIRFYNYYLMEHDIDCQRPMRFNEETGLFKYIDDNPYSFANKEDRDAEAEINDIKKRVLKKDRPLFFK